MNAEVHPVMKKKKISHKNSAERERSKKNYFWQRIDPTYLKGMMYAKHTKKAHVAQPCFLALC